MQSSVNEGTSGSRNDVDDGLPLAVEPCRHLTSTGKIRPWLDGTTLELVVWVMFPRFRYLIVNSRGAF